MLVLRIPQGEHVTIYDLLDPASQPIKIVITPQGSFGIQASSRYSLVRSDAKNTNSKYAKEYPQGAANRTKGRRAKA
jgi:hypothetical protein